MISKITLQGKASYINQTTLETDKNINLIYGLNGSGKSTLSEFLRQKNSPEYSKCIIYPPINEEEEEILVYNEKYVNDVFYSTEKQKGIFTLSKENVDARKRIDSAREELTKLQNEYKGLEASSKDNDEEWNNISIEYNNKFWEIKNKYAGSDRVFDYCFVGKKGSKELLTSFLVDLELCENSESLEDIKQELIELNNAKGNKIQLIPSIMFSLAEYEHNDLFSQVITGNKDSMVSSLIDGLRISDWVQKGLEIETNGVCPFCQRKFEDDRIISALKQYFDKEYENRVQQVRIIQNEYSKSLSTLNYNYDNAFSLSLLADLRQSFNSKYSKLQQLLNDNISRINEKLLYPSRIISLLDTTPLIEALNELINQANNRIMAFNSKIEAIDSELLAIKKKFWDFIRFSYDPSIREYNKRKEAYTSRKSSLDTKIRRCNEEISKQRQIIEHEQKNIVSIEDSINNINSMLLDMGIVDFYIAKCKDDEESYMIVRNDKDSYIFSSLSEGERTIISVLYFIESCKGIFDKTKATKSRIIVIDDPVSSLSTMYVFNIGRLIRNMFYPSYERDKTTKEISIKKKFEQVFILTHSLYFFYEMTEMDKDKRHAAQSLFRISKGSSGSTISEMRYEHIQSDYHSYWMTIQDPQTSPALIANCMRNIIEYFFNFVEQRDLNNVFNQEKFKSPRYQAFLRYINRESHSLGQNIYDFKDFDYKIFMEALEAVFDSAGYKGHFDKMMHLA